MDYKWLAPECQQDFDSQRVCVGGVVKEFDSGKTIWVTYVVAIALKVLGTRVTLVIVTRGHTVIVAGGHTVNCGTTRKTEK